MKVTIAMTELVESIAKALVDNPGSVMAVTSSENPNVVELRVASEDMGKVIGKQGRIARAIRIVVKAASAKSKKNMTVEILSDDE